MKNVICAVCGIFLILSSNLAWSGADSGVYIGAAIGSTNQDIDTSELSFNDDAAGKKIFVGYHFGWLPLLDIAMEGSLIDFGEITTANTAGNSSAKLDGISGSGLIGVKLGIIGLFAKTGVINWDSDTQITGTTIEDTGSDVIYGAGVKIQFGSLAVRAEYEIIETENIDIDFYTAGLSWTF